MKWHPLLPPPTRAVSRPNSVPLPFRTPATQAKFFPINKKNTWHAFFFCSFLYRCFARLQRETQKLPRYTFFLGGNFECAPVHFFCRCRSFSPWWQLAFPLFLTAALKFLCFSSNEIGLLWFFFSRSSSFSVLQTLKLSRKKESAFVTKRPGSYAIYRRNARVLEMQNFIPAYTKRWTHVRTYPVRTIFSEPKFLGCMEYYGRDPFDQNSDRSDRKKRTTSKGGPVFSKLFRLDRTDPLSFGPKFPESLVEWIAPYFLPFVLRERASCARELRYYFAQGVLGHFPLPHSISV